MEFIGTIVITDPCYLSQGIDPDLWEESDYGEDLSVFGCSQWISEDTNYGDWSCTVYKGPKSECETLLMQIDDLYVQLDHLSRIDPNFVEKEQHLNDALDYLSYQFDERYSKLGRFCADAGMVCVVYLDEVLKVNPHFKEWVNSHPWCATIIEDFDGDIEYDIDKYDNAHIIGTGNINFYTVQTGY